MHCNTLMMCFQIYINITFLLATVLGSIPASSDTGESERRPMNQCWIKYKHKKMEKKSPFNFNDLQSIYRITKVHRNNLAGTCKLESWRLGKLVF